MSATPAALKEQIGRWAAELGFQGFGVTHCDLSSHERALRQWTDAGMHGEMAYMVRHGSKRSQPAELVPGTLSLLSLRMNYYPADAADSWTVLEDGRKGFVSRYALGRDYHKLMRRRLAQLAQRIERQVGPFGNRVFVDSAPVLERGIAENSGVGWIGKHTNLIHHRSGSWFFLGEIYTDLALPADAPAENHCGRCSACIDSCPTAAIVAPYRLDARRCISYLTIELQGNIPLALRKAIGNRIYGCDDCQLVCPWNRFAQPTTELDFTIRHGLDAPDLVTLLQWDEQTFQRRMEGSPIRRLGHQRWQRNIAVALGNSGDPATIEVLLAAQQGASELLQTHLHWAVEQLRATGG